MGAKQKIRSWEIRLLLQLILILGLSLGASGCQQDKILVQIFGLQGQILESLGHHQKAVAAFNRAIEYDPDQASVYGGRGLAHFHQDHFDEAIADYDQALKLNPKLAAAYLNRGYAYSKKGQYDQALADYNRAIDLDPTDALFYNNRGEAYRHKGLPDRAMADYNRALELNPQMAMAYSNRGLIYYTQGQMDQALAEYQRSIQANPKYALAYNNRARLYYEIKQYELAWQDVQKVQSLRCQMDDQFLENLQQALAREKKAPGSQPGEKKPTSSRSPREATARLYKTLNPVLGYAGLAFWGAMLLEFFIWKTLGRRSLKKPIKIPAEFGLERKDEYLAGRRNTLQNALKHLERFSKGLGFPIIISCLGLSVMGALGWVSHQHFSFDSLLLAGLLIPGYFSIVLVKTITQD
jgi:tetratricopeptide (TPR) repeat protein